MNRRQLLSLAGSAVLAGTAGAAEFDRGDRSEGAVSSPSPTVDAPDVHTAQGAGATLEVRATGVTGLRFGLADLEAWRELDVQFDARHVHPGPDDVGYSYPPTWGWESPTDVTVELPIAVPGGAPPAEYRYEVVALGDVGDERTSRRGTIAVTEQ